MRQKPHPIFITISPENISKSRNDNKIISTCKCKHCVLSKFVHVEQTASLSHCQCPDINIYRLQGYLESLMKALSVSLPGKYINWKRLINI